MKKTVIAIFALAMVSLPSFAKDETTCASCANCNGCNCDTFENGAVVASKAGKNWEISAGLGVQAYFGEYTKAMGNNPGTRLGDLITFPSVNLMVSKWASPVWGVGIGVNYSKVKNPYTIGDAGVATFANFPDDPIIRDAYFVATGSYLNPYILVNVDFTNWFGGYRERVFNLIGRVGAGVIIPFGNVGEFYNVTGERVVCPTGNFGLTGRFNIAKRWAIDINLNGGITADEFNGICYANTGVRQRSVEIFSNATLGVTYKFGFTTLKNHSTGAYTESMYWVPLTTAIACSKTLKDATDAASAESAALAAAAEARAKAAEDALAKAQADAAAAEARAKAAEAKKVDFDYWQLINFKIDRTELSNREKVNIQAAADVLKSFPDAKIIVKGYADKQTGKADYNQKLSEKRAQVVKNYLVNECGLNADNIEIASNGGVDYMYFNDPQCSRSAVIAIAK